MLRDVRESDDGTEFEEGDSDEFILKAEQGSRSFGACRWSALLGSHDVAKPQTPHQAFREVSLIKLLGILCTSSHFIRINPA